MIDFDAVTDTPIMFGTPTPLFVEASIHLPVGRYALMSPTPELQRPVVDLLTGVRPPDEGIIRHDGRVSWAIGRQGFVRGRTTGANLIDLVASLYNVDAEFTNEVVSALLSRPECLDEPVEHWPPFVRQEFTFALALVPDFDVYVIDGPIPFEPTRFSRLWQALFEERIAGKTLILASYRKHQLEDYCAQGLIYEHHLFRVDDDLAACVERYPTRPLREEIRDENLTGAENVDNDIPF